MKIKKISSKLSKIKNSQRGFAAFFITILIMIVVFGIAISISILTYHEQKISQNIIKSSQAYYIAEAGIEDSIYRIIKGKNYEVTNSLRVGEGLASINIIEEEGKKIVVSKGEVFQRIRKLKTTLITEATTITFYYGAQVDQGGLTIQPNARVIGNVYSNGNIKGAGATKDYSTTCPSSDSCITGDAWVAGGVAPDPDQQCIEQNSDFPFGIKVGPTDYLDTAQSFVPSTSAVLNIVSFYIKKAGSPPDQTVRILTDDNGNPSRTSLASGTLRSSKVTSNYSWVNVSFDPPPNLTAGTTYWIMIDVFRDNNNYWIWGKDNTDYCLGTGKYTRDWSAAGAVWTGVGGDLNFKTWMAGLITYLDGAWVGVDVHANSITNSNIIRDAYFQSIDDVTKVWGTKYSESQDAPTKDLPISYGQIEEWERAACCDTGAGCKSECIELGNYNPPDGSTLGPKKINGNLTFPSNGTITITGPLWVTGKILAENNVTIKLQENLTAGYPIIADNPSDQINFGKIKFNNNVITIDSPLGGKLLFISINESLDPNNPAIWLYNNVNKDNAQSIIFSLQGLIKVENNVKFKQITGYSIYLANNAEIVYEEGLINSNFSSGPGGGWKIANWSEVE